MSKSCSFVAVEILVAWYVYCALFVLAIKLVPLKYFLFLSLLTKYRLIVPVLLMLNVKILHFMSVGNNKLPSRFNFIAHQYVKIFIGQ